MARNQMDSLLLARGGLQNRFYYLCLFVIHKMGIIMVPTLLGCYEVSVKQYMSNHNTAPETRTHSTITVFVIIIMFVVLTT
jgi:hypothetical protein